MTTHKSKRIMKLQYYCSVTITVIIDLGVKDQRMLKLKV